MDVDLVEQILHTIGSNQISGRDGVAQSIIRELLRAGLELRKEPSLEEMKELLVTAHRQASQVSHPFSPTTGLGRSAVLAVHNPTDGDSMLPDLRP